MNYQSKKETKMPKISVLMSAFNAEKYIGETIESVLDQSFIDFEFIIINDGSTDQTEAIIKKYKDERIRYFYQENSGLSKALNYGLKISKGDYIARIDADDLCYRNRLEIQYEFMENNPDYVVCGSYTDVIDENGKFIYQFSGIPSLNKDIQLEMKMKNCIVHSSSFYTRDAALKINGYYEPIKQYFEDYMFFSQIIKIGKAFNFDYSLIKYRVTPGSISTRTKEKKYDKLVKDVIKRGFILDDEKVYLFSLKVKKSKKYIQLSNHYLTLSRLILTYQKDYINSILSFTQAVKIYPFNMNILYTAGFLIIEGFKPKMKKK
jgi:glycosyltransferase involved in cell wall biosynthesis